MKEKIWNLGQLKQDEGRGREEPIGARRIGLARNNGPSCPMKLCTRQTSKREW